MADVTLIRSGRWGLSRAVQEADGGWTTYASQQRLAATVEHYWPPQAADGTPLVNAVLVRGSGGSFVSPTDGNTVLFPRDIADLADVTLGDLTGQQRNAWRNTLETWLTGYTFTDFDGAVRIVVPFADVVATYTNATTLRQIARDIFRHLAHSVSRVRTAPQSSHNTQFLDDFSTDPFAGRWTKESSDAVWDSVNNEVDAVHAAGDLALRYSANGPGSIEHEAQVTGASNGSGAGNHLAGAAVRFDDAGVNDYYFLNFAGASTLSLRKAIAGVVSTLENSSIVLTNTAGDFYTFRLAASGVAGANVVLDYWATDHDTTKPSSFAWYGTDASPEDTYTDSAADRLDAASHSQCGFASIANTGGNYDSRHCWWGSRAISDRGGAGRTTKNTRAHPLGVEHGMGFRMAG